MYSCLNNTADCSLLFSLHNLNFLSQVLREYDRIHPIYDCQKIVEYWGSLVPTIIEIAKNEDKGEIITLLDGEDDFSDGKHALINTKYGVEEYLFTTVSYIHRIQEHRSNLCAVLPCAGSKDCQEPRPNCHHFGGELKGG